jgi:hypothetical protein
VVERAEVQRPTWPSHISDFEPRAPIVGQPFTIIGNGFGGDPGTVMFLVGEHLFEAEVTGWTSSRITARVPHDVLPWDDMGDVPDNVPGPRGQALGQDCEVWIRLQDDLFARLPFFENVRPGPNGFPAEGSRIDVLSGEQVFRQHHQGAPAG